MANDHTLHQSLVLLSPTPLQAPLSKKCCCLWVITFWGVDWQIHEFWEGCMKLISYFDQFYIFCSFLNNNLKLQLNWEKNSSTNWQQIFLRFAIQACTWMRIISISWKWVCHALFTFEKTLSIFYNIEKCILNSSHT